MPMLIEANEVDGFRTAIAGLEVEYVRTGPEPDACWVLYNASGEIQLTTGKMGFSTISYVEIPRNTTVISLNTSAPPGASWCGIHPEPGTVNVYGPGTPFVGINPVGFGATILVTPNDAIERTVGDLRLGEPSAHRSVRPLAGSAETGALRTALWRVTEAPGLMDDPVEQRRLLDTAVTAIFAADGGVRPRADRRLDSKRIVLDCINHVEATQSHHPAMSELCRAASASQSRVRQAFVEVLDASPMQYFQYRLLGRLRNELVQADPAVESVTRIASSLGVTQLGRIAGRYRRLFDELPSETLRR